ncbi:MAG: hypothetical protein JXR37_11935 [Kiritimatiellae bacterium]|nr:hypothetical protein [Kiritimatiellia bacterium]
MRRISSRCTLIHKFVWPWLWLGGVGVWFRSLVLSDFPFGGPLLLWPVFVLYGVGGAYWVWYAWVVKNVHLDDEGLAVAGAFRRDRVRWANLAGVVQRKWPAPHPIRVVLKQPCAFGRNVYFVPSQTEKMRVVSKLSLRERFRRIPHPIVAELSARIAPDTGPAAAAPGARGPVCASVALAALAAVAVLFGDAVWGGQGGAAGAGAGPVVGHLSLAQASPPSGGTVIERFGCRVTVPWTADMEEEHLERLYAVKFSTGQKVVLTDPENWASMLAEVRRESFEGSGLLRWVFAGVGEYAFYREMYAGTPVGRTVFAQMNLRMWRKMVRGMRGAYLTRYSAVYDFERAGYRGFQAGAPDQDALCHVVLFGEDDRFIEFFVSRQPDSDVVITQDELSAIIQSFELTR